jgi:hypothetical protein
MLRFTSICSAPEIARSQAVSRAWAVNRLGWPGACRQERGVTLGNPRLDDVRNLAVEATRAEAARYAANVLPIIREIQPAGATSLRAIARARSTRRPHGAGVDAGADLKPAQTDQGAAKKP